MRPVVELGPPLTDAQRARFLRHLLLPQLGEDGQRRLAHARVAVVGAGGLGSPALLYLAAAGIGRIGVVDDDLVDLTNLQRQVVHGDADVGRRKVDSARDAVLALAPDAEVVTHPVRLTPANAADVLRGYDLVLDGTDNFPTRYLVADTCAALGVPLVWGSVLGFDAQVAVFWPTGPVADDGTRPPGLRDLFPEPPADGTVPSCAQAGVLGALCGQVGAVMATEAVKLVTGTGEPLLGRVLVLDALAARWSEVPLRAVGATPVAARARPASDSVPAVDADTLAARLDAHEPGLVLLDVREPAEHVTGTVPGSRSLPMAELLTPEGRATLPRDVPIVVLCATGLRSAVAVAALRADGFADVAHLEGGLVAWQRVRPGSPAPVR